MQPGNLRRRGVGDTTTPTLASDGRGAGPVAHWNEPNEKQDGHETERGGCVTDEPQITWTAS